jgi:hypothetical protein
MSLGAIGIPVSHGVVGALPTPPQGSILTYQRVKYANYDNYDNYAMKPPYGQPRQEGQT